MLREHERHGLEGSWEWLAFAAQLPSKIVPLNNLQANTSLITGRCIVTGINCENTAGGSGIINLRDGADNTGPYFSILPLATNGTANIVFGTTGVLCELGVFAEIATATIRGAVFYIPLWHYEFTPPGD